MCLSPIPAAYPTGPADPFEPELLAAIAVLRNRAFGRSLAAEEYERDYRRLLVANPAAGPNAPAGVFIAGAPPALQAHLGALPLRVRIAGRAAVAGSPFALAAAPGSGVAAIEVALDFLRSQTIASCTTAGDPLAYRIWNRLGCLPMPQGRERYYCFFHAPAVARKLAAARPQLARWLERAAPLFDGALRIRCRLLERYRRSRWQASPAADFDETFGALWQSFAQPFSFAVERDADYLRWRYPEGAGLWTVRKPDGSLLGYAVTERTRNQEFSRLTIREMVAQPENVGYAALLSAILRNARGEDLDFIECWGLTEAARRALQQFGFWRYTLPHSPYLLYCSDQHLARLAIRSAYFSPGDAF